MAQRDEKIKVIQSYPQLDEELESIVERLNSQPGLALAALANPLLAIEELGYELAPEAREEMEDRLRFRPPEAEHLRKLRRQVFEQAGRRFDPASDDEVGRVLFEEIGLERGKLEELEGKHPIVAPLIEYRRLDRQEPRFAAPGVYRSVRAGRRKLPLTGVKAKITRKRSGG